MLTTAGTDGTGSEHGEMTDPIPPRYPVTPPPPPTGSWTTQDPYAPYAGHLGQPYAGGPDPYGQLPYQPYAGGPGGQLTAKPPAYWPLSIVALLFSFLFGAIAIYFSVQVGRRWDRGDLDGSRRASRTARVLGVIAIVVGVVATAVLLAAGRL
jgi:hypothetical protein